MNTVPSQPERRRAIAAALPPLSLVARDSAALKDTPDPVRLFHTPARLDQEEIWREVEAETPGVTVFQSNPLSD